MLNEMTVVQLRELLRERGLKISGRKAELIERIEQFDEAIENYNTTEDILAGHGAMYGYINGGNEHTASEIAEVRQFLNFLKNIARHTEVKTSVTTKTEPIESDEEDVTEPAQDEEVNEPADEQEPSLVNKPITAFEGRTTLGKFIKSGIASKQYTVIHSDGYDFPMFNDQLCASEGFDSVTAVAKDGEIVKVYRLSSRCVSETCIQGDELRRL